MRTLKLDWLVTVLALAGLSLIQAGCENKSTNGPPINGGGSGDQYALIYLEQISVNPPWNMLFALVTASPLPSFNYLTMNDTSFSSADYFPGYLEAFSDIDSTQSLGNSLAVELSTSAGTITGNLNLVDPPTNITTNCDSTDTLSLDEDLVISFQGGDFDFCMIYGTYWWNEGPTGHAERLDTFTVGNTLTIDGSRFTHDGIITIDGLYCLNGPLPTPGTGPNMSGQGTGYLCDIWIDFTHLLITVGQGSSVIPPGGDPPTPEERQAFLRDKLCEWYGLPF